MGRWHAGNLSRQSGLKVVAVADVNRSAAQLVAGEVGATVRDVDELIAVPEVTAVVVASTDETHARYATAAIEAGKPILLEKPLGATLDQARSILDAELAAGHRLVRVGFMRELDPAHVELERELTDLRPITKIRCVHRNVDSNPRPTSVLLSQSVIHDVHTMRWLSGEEIVAVQVHVVERDDGFRYLLLVCNLAGGGLAVAEFEDRAFAYEVQVEVTARHGMVATLPHPRTIVRRAGKEYLPVGADWFGRFEDAYRLEIEEGAATLADGVPRGPSTWDGYAAQVVIDAAERSMESSAMVPVQLPPKPDLYHTP